MSVVLCAIPGHHGHDYRDCPDLTTGREHRDAGKNGKTGRERTSTTGGTVSSSTQERSFIADVLHDCLSSFQGIEGDTLTFDRDGAVEYLLSPASGLTITVDGPEPVLALACFCGQPDDRERVHRSNACTPWVSRD